MSIYNDRPIEKTVSELVALSKKSPLRDKADLERVKVLMSTLRQMGFTSHEIKVLINGAWREPTIKLYTRGTTVQDGSIKERGMALMAEMIRQDLSLEDVKENIVSKSILDKRGISTERFCAVLQESDDANLDLAKISTLEEEFETSGLTIKQLQDALKYKAELESAGFTIDSLSKMATAAKICGKGNNHHPDKVIEAIIAYGDIVTIREGAEKERTKLDATKRQCEVAEKAMQSIRQESERMADEIKVVKEIKALGFEKSHFAKIKEISEKIANESLLSLSSQKQGGKPVDQFLNSLSQYYSIVRQQKVLEYMQQKITKAREEIDKLQKEIDRRRGIIETCDQLVEKGFSVVAIQQIYNSASAYGDPVRVLKAVEEQGRTQNLQLKINEQDKIIARNDARIQEQQKQIASIKGMYDGLNASIQKLLEPFVLSVQQRVTESIQNISATYTALTTKMQLISKSHAEREAIALQFEPELKMARILILVRSFPDGARLIHPEFAVQLADTLAKFCRVHEINLQVHIPRELLKDKQGYDINYIDSYPLMILLKGHLERHVESIVSRTKTNTMTVSDKE